MSEHIIWHTEPCSVSGHCLLIGPSTGSHELSVQMPIETAEYIVRACNAFADIEEGISLIARKDYYYRLEAQAKSQPDLLTACKFAKAQIKKGAQKKALPILRAAIAKAKEN